MAFSINKVMVFGNIGQDIEVRVVGNSSVGSFSIATSEGYKDKNDNWVNDTEWHNIVLWKPTDYQINQIRTGRQVFVEGKLKTDTFEDKQGNKKSITKIIARQIVFVNDNSRGQVKPHTQEELVDLDDPFA